MDLNFSPDWPAWVCYLIVLIFGAFTGWREVIEKLNDTTGVWRHPTAWSLVIILALTPLFLFWLLDRVGALHDTSGIAAAIVGIAYTQILKGDSEYKAPGSTTAIWNFLSWWRDRITMTLLERTQRNLAAFIQAVTQRLADPQALARATALALKLTKDPVAFQAMLAEKRKELAAANPPIAVEVVDYRMATLVYREIFGSDDKHRLMVSEGLIEQAFVDRYFSSRRSRLVAFCAGLIVVLVVAGIAIGLDGLGTAKFVEREYLVSRLAKPNSTSHDLDRVAGRLSDRLTEPSTAGVDAEFWLRRIVTVLRDSTMPTSRVDKVVQIALSARDRDAITAPALAGHLVPALRTSNVDTRRRVQLALKDLAKSVGPEPDGKLKDWDPTEGDSITDIEEKIRAWRAHWAALAKKP